VSSLDPSMAAGSSAGAPGAPPAYPPPPAYSPSGPPPAYSPPSSGGLSNSDLLMLSTMKDKDEDEKKSHKVLKWIGGIVGGIIVFLLGFALGKRVPPTEGK
jgi:hypothetical protein